MSHHFNNVVKVNKFCQNRILGKFYNQANKTNFNKINKIQFKQTLCVSRNRKRQLNKLKSKKIKNRIKKNKITAVKALKLLLWLRMISLVENKLLI